MWHEARKQERRIRGLIVDYRRRAERRQDFYEKIQADPTQFIQVHGRRCKIHLDPAVAAAGDGAAIIVPWQGQQDNLIDRFDVRAHLDYIPPLPKNSDTDTEISSDERQCNYERYRILAQNDFLNVPEEKFLHQLYLEEQFGAKAQVEAERNMNKKKQQKSGATIGYSYEDSTSSIGPQPFSHLMQVTGQSTTQGPSKSDSESDSDSDMDMDVSIDISKLDTAQAHELNACGRNYGMCSNDFYSYLTKDADEADALRIAREEEQEKILLSGRKSRRERRAQKERRIACRPFSPPSYAAKEDFGNKEKEEETDSRSPSPSETNAGKITYITSFGGEDELQPHAKISISIGKGLHNVNEAQKTVAVSNTASQVTYAQKVKENLEQLKQLNQSTKRNKRSHGKRSSSRSYSRSRSRGRERRQRVRSRTRSRSRSYDRRRRDRYSRSRSSSREYTRRGRRHHKRRSRSRSGRYRHHKRSISSSTRSSRSSSHSNSSPYSRRKCDGNNQNKKLSNYKPSTLKQKQSPPPSTISTIQTEKKPSEIIIARPLKLHPSAEISKGLTQTVIPGMSTTTSATATSAEMTMPEIVEPPPPPLKRYYGRKRGDDSSSESECETDDNYETRASKTQTGDGNDSDDRTDVDTTLEMPDTLIASSSSGKQTGKYSTAQAKNPSFSSASDIKEGGGSRVMNLRERLKRKMQNLLNKQYKADKRAEIEKSEREKQLQQERDDEMRELALKLRRRQRELRHRYGTPSTGKSSEDSDAIATEIVKVTKSKRSKSNSSEQSNSEMSRTLQTRTRIEEDCYKETQPRRSRSAGRKRSRSRSSSYTRVHHRRSRSRSRNKRSASRKRRRSRHRERSTEYSSRYTSQRSGYDDRHRRSKSRGDRGRDYRDRERQREREKDRDRERNRYQRESEAMGRGSSNKACVATSTSADAASSSRTRVVISAPPKLKKLVDY